MRKVLLFGFLGIILFASCKKEPMPQPVIVTPPPPVQQDTTKYFTFSATYWTPGDEDTTYCFANFSAPAIQEKHVKDPSRYLAVYVLLLGNEWAALNHSNAGVSSEVSYGIQRVTIRRFRSASGKIDFTPATYQLAVR